MGKPDQDDLMQILVDWFQQKMQSRHRVAFMLPLYYLQRGRLAEALHAYTTVKDGFQGSQGLHHLDDMKHASMYMFTYVSKYLQAGTHHQLT